MEVVWYFLQHLGVGTAAWVMVVSAAPQLPAHVVVRSAVGLNVTWVDVEADEPCAEVLEPLAADLRREVKVADGLPAIRWAQGRDKRWTCGRVWVPCLVSET